MNDQEIRGSEILARALHVNERTLIEIIGGPWDVCVEPSVSSPETRLPGQVFIGRVGPSVTIQVHDGQVRIGKAIGKWEGPHPLVWDMTDPMVSIPLDEIGSRTQQFSDAVDAACKAKRRSLRVCRYCASFNGPEFMFDSDICYGCANGLQGVVY